jgi:transposase
LETEALVDHLVELGLTRNQSLAWLTLLIDDSGQGLTGYEVGARSGVPRSAVYKVLQQLEETGAAFSVGQEPQRFVAAAPEQWIASVRRRTLTRLDGVALALRSLPRPSRPEPVWIVRSYVEVMDRARELLRSAQVSVAFSAWRREIELLRPVLDELAPRGLHRVLHCPEPLPDPPAGFCCWTDDLDPGKAHWSHNLLLVVDRKAALMGGAEPGRDNDAVHTTNSSVVDLAVNHVILDVTLLSRRTGRPCDLDVAPLMRPTLEARVVAPDLED